MEVVGRSNYDTHVRGAAHNILLRNVLEQTATLDKRLPKQEITHVDNHVTSISSNDHPKENGRNPKEEPPSSPNGTFLELDLNSLPNF